MMVGIEWLGVAEKLIIVLLLAGIDIYISYMTFEMEMYYEWPSIVHLNSISYVGFGLTSSNC